MTRKFFNSVVSAVAIGGMIFTNFGDIAAAAVKLSNGEIDGFIRANSPAFRFKNQSRPNAPLQRALGEDFTFTAQQGETIDIAVEVEDGSTLKPILVLIATKTNRQVAYDDRANSLQYTVPAAGEYKLLVLGQNNTRGRYTLVISGLGEGAQVNQTDVVMRDILQLRSVGCGVPNVAKITIGSEERCTRDLDPGQYVYQESTRTLKAVDATRDLLARELQLTVLDSCPPAGRPTVKITVAPPPTNGTNNTYCATPTRFVRAGEYTYDTVADELKPGITQNPSSQTAQQRKQFLLNEYGLTLLDSCPAVRTGVVEATFPEATYCATPNRVIRAGKYTFNASTGDLVPAQRPAECAVTVAGVCVVK